MRSSKCKKCVDLLKRKSERPSKEDLKLQIDKIGFAGVGRKFGVSTTTIRKWIKNENLEILENLITFAMFSES